MSHKRRNPTLDKRFQWYLLPRANQLDPEAVATLRRAAVPRSTYGGGLRLDLTGWRIANEDRE